jgi:DNA sulfur modification protein DndD
MHLRSIVLRDWKAYVQARFDFPVPTRTKNVILIGAENGFGKTSLFEALILGLFGRDGLPLIARAPFGGAGDDRLQVSYKKFLEGALHARAIEEGRSSCSVQLTFEDDDNEPIEIRRVWSFGPSGVFNNPYNSEDVTVFEGTARRAKGPSGLLGQDRLDWYRDYVAKTFLPSTLAVFFMFDGERVSEFADRDMTAQVRTGIEGLLGIPVLRDLAEDLRDYARSKRIPVKNGEGAMPRLEEERAVVKAELESVQRQIASVEPSVTRLRQEQNRLTNELAGFGAGTQAQMQELVTRIADHQKAVEAGEDRLRIILAGDLALAVTGTDLRNNTIEQLKREQVREDWQASRDQGNRGLDRFIEALDGAARQIEPALVDEQRSALQIAVRDTWEALWHPEPPDCAEAFLHPYLRGSDRAQIEELLLQASQLGGGSIVQLLDDISANRAAMGRLQEELSRTQGIGPELDAKRDALKQTINDLEKANRELGAHKATEVALSGRLDNLNKDIARATAHADQRQPEVRRAARAQKVAAMIDDLIQEAVPGQILDVANAMTEAYREMAHKTGLVRQIEISEDCSVKLVNQRGRDLRDLDLSAGEKQIFTQSLISAIASVSGRSFPMIVDTPLGRLDHDHREAVLKHLSKRNGQVILLSTNTEVIGPYLDAISPHVSKSYRVKHEQDGDVGRSWPVEGYFSEASS